MGVPQSNSLLALRKGFGMSRWVLVAVLVASAVWLFGIGEGTAAASADTWPVECQLAQAELALGEEGAVALIYAWDPQWVGTPGTPDAYITPTLPEYLSWYGFVC